MLEVQLLMHHSRNVGFLRYWTLSNLPLFLLAAPVLYVLLRSGLHIMSSSALLDPHAVSRGKPKVEQAGLEISERSRQCLRRLAIPQLLVSILAITNFHVQIINRLSSGYPLWYLSIAASLTSMTKLSAFKLSEARALVQWTILYALIQGVLFASFLPPA